jgi:transposase
VTVDVGKTKNWGYWRCPNRDESKPFEFFNNGRGFQSFWGIISKTLREKKLEKVVVGLESTGCYGEPLVHYLRKKGVRLVQVNPMHTKKLKELQGNSPNKTDQKDPKVIADIIEYGHSLTLVVPEGPAAELRRLMQTRERAIKRLNALFSQLHDLEFILFPEFVQIMKGVKGKTARYFLAYVPTPRDIVASHRR